MLVDTDVLIWNMRGNEKAAKFLDSIMGFELSVVSWMELAGGARNRQEVVTLRRALRFWNAQIVQISEEISTRGAFLIEKHALGDGLRLADALVAATAIELAQPLATGNVKHYRAIDGLDLHKFKP